MDRVYDYIRGYDFSKQKFDVFVEGLKIHALLYSACPYPEFGGQLRDNTAVLKDEIVEVPPASEAKKYFQSFIGYDNLSNQVQQSHKYSLNNSCGVL